MDRIFPPAIAALVALLLTASGVHAQDAAGSWPAGIDETRGPGFYFAIYKIVLFLIPIFLWAKTTAWAAKDLEEFGSVSKLPADVWTPVLVFTFLGVFLILGLTIPIFAAGYALSLIGWGAPLITYIALRDAKLSEDRRILTLPGMQRLLVSLISKKGNQKEQAPRMPWEMGPPVDLTATGPDNGKNQAAQIEARQAPVYVSVKMLFADAIQARAEKIRLEYTADAVGVRYMIDGVWLPGNPKVHEKDPLNRALGDAMLLVLKRLAQVNPQDRRSQQKGKFQTAFEGNKYDTQFISQGTQTGEVVMITFVLITKVVRTLDELGMRDKMLEKVKEQLREPQSLIVFCAMPGDGLSMTWLGMLKAVDRLMRDFVSIEDVNKREPELENVDINKYDPAKGETAADTIKRIALKQPDTFIVPEIPDAAAIDALTAQIVDEGRNAIISLRAREATEALLRLAAMKPDQERFLSSVKAIINQRMIRKLCDSCREAVPLSPEMAQRLRIPPGRVQFIYREKQPPPPGQEPPKKKKGEPEICPKCKGIGYFGRTAIYELLIVTDALRDAIRKNPRIEVLRQVAAQGGHPSLQEEGILLIAAGTTSIPELQRVLKA